MITHICLGLSAVFLLIALFNSNQESQKVDETIAQKKVYDNKFSDQLETIEAHQSKMSTAIIENTNALARLEKNIADKFESIEKTQVALFTDHDSIYDKIDKNKDSISELREKIASKRPIIRLPTSIPVSIISDQPAQASPTRPKKPLGKGIKSVIQEQAK